MSSPARTASVIFYGLLTGQVLFFLAALAFQRSVVPPENLDAVTVLYASIAFFFASGTGSFLLGNRLLNTAAGGQTVDARGAGYVKAVVVRLALLEGPEMLFLVGYLLSGERTFLVLFLLGLMVLWYQRPSVGEWERVRGS